MDADLDVEVALEIAMLPMYISIESDERKVKMREDQINTSLLGKVFRMMPDSIILCTEDGEIAGKSGPRREILIDVF